MANNNFPQHVTEQIIKQNLDKYMNETTTHSTDKIKFFVRLFSIRNFNKQKQTLQCIIKEHIKPVNQQQQIHLHAYFKPFKLSSSFTTRKRQDPLQQTHVVYQFQCSNDGCHASYLGYTSCKLERRANQHRYAASSIYKHYKEDHDQPPPPLNTIKQCFSILYKFNNINELKIIEAIAIREKLPFLNIKYNEMSNFLNIYK